MNGTDLKIKRIAAHIKAKDVALAAGWNASRISRLEARAHVEPDDVAAYVAALATLTTKTTDSEAVA